MNTDEVGITHQKQWWGSVAGHSRGPQYLYTSVSLPTMTTMVLSSWMYWKENCGNDWMLRDCDKLKSVYTGTKFYKISVLLYFNMSIIKLGNKDHK